MKPRWLIGVVAVVLMAAPASVRAQRGAAGGFAPAGVRVGSASVGSGPPHSAAQQRTPSPGPASVVPVANSVPRPLTNPANVREVDAPSRHAAFPTAPRRQHPGGGRPAGGGPPLGSHHNPPKATPQVVYLLGVGGYYYAAPSDESGDQAEDATQQDAEQDSTDDTQQAAVIDDGEGERRTVRRNLRVAGRLDERSDDRMDLRSDAGAQPQSQSYTGEATPEQDVAAQHEQEPLPDVGTLTLVLRDGARLDVVAFTMTQGNVIYITPEGLRLEFPVSQLDADTTQTVNQQRGTPMQLPI
jgi:hypothetical protein